MNEILALLFMLNIITTALAQLLIFYILANYDFSDKEGPERKDNAKT